MYTGMYGYLRILKVSMKRIFLGVFSEWGTSTLKNCLYTGQLLLECFRDARVGMNCGKFLKKWVRRRYYDVYLIANMQRCNSILETYSWSPCLFE